MRGAAADPTRSPEGTETAWGYTHVPNPVVRPGAVRWDEATIAGITDRMENEVERRAPGMVDRFTQLGVRPLGEREAQEVLSHHARKLSEAAPAAERWSEEAVSRVGVKTAVHLEEITGSPAAGEQSPLKPINSKPSRGNKAPNHHRKADRRRKKT